MTDAEAIGKRLPHSLGPYRIEREIGTGAMGTVFMAVHTGLERPVALKVMRPDLLEDSASVRRFLREGKAIARLEHPHIVAVYDAGEIDGMYYIAMKLLEGETLEHLLARSGPPSIDRVVRLVSQLATGLHYAHGRGVIHRDVKPANIIIGENDQTTLTDFGIAQALYAGTARSTTITGTPLYMSPEQIQGLDVDGRSDIYALGAVLYELSTGHPPFEGQMVTVMYSQLHSPIPNIRETIPSIPENLALIVERALAKNPAERFQTAGEMAQELARSGGEGAFNPGVTVNVNQSTDATTVLGRVDDKVDDWSVRAERGPQTVPRRRPWFWPAVGAIGTLALVGAVAGYLLSQTGSSTGSLAMVSEPTGALVTIDGRTRGRAPVTVPGLRAGKHTITLSLPTYILSRLVVTVDGGKVGTIRAPLKSVAAQQLVSVPRVVLTSSFTTDNVTHQIIPGVSLSSIRASEATARPVYLLVQFEIPPSVAAMRDVRFTPGYALYAPSGSPFGASPASTAITLTHNHPDLVWKGGFRLHVRGRIAPPTGTYTIRLLADGKSVKSITFRVT